MTGPRTPGWRPWAAGFVFLALVIGGLLVARPEAEPPPSPVATPAEQPAPARPIVPQPQPPLGRADLVEAVQLAASQYAAGEPIAVALLAGRRFAVNLPFGCSGPVDDLEAARSGWTYNPESRSLRAKVEPQVWTDAPFIDAIAGPVAFEAAEGFWIERPWSRSENCPPGAGPSTEAAAVRETLAIVELFAPGAKRADRRSGRAYQAVQTMEPGAMALDRGFRLRVEGRLVALGDKPPIGCWSESPALRPICVVSARFDRIAITDASDSQTFAEWKD